MEPPALIFVLPPVEDPELSLEPDPGLGPVSEPELPTFVLALVSLPELELLPLAEDPELSLEPDPGLGPVLEPEFPTFVFALVSFPELELLFDPDPVGETESLEELFPDE
ncbi:hypothetical protein LEP1GSC055_2809 [Leptospira borgpetersenii str. Brem 307]|nr:hypothetical protein LEP1GSC055_2809 [Leptospira borgpetersenii str. Brem 307]